MSPAQLGLNWMGMFSSSETMLSFCLKKTILNQGCNNNKQDWQIIGNNSVGCLERKILLEKIRKAIQLIIPSRKSPWITKLRVASPWVHRMDTWNHYGKTSRLWVQKWNPFYSKNWWPHGKQAITPGNAENVYLRFWEEKGKEQTTTRWLSEDPFLEAPLSSDSPSYHLPSCLPVSLWGDAAALHHLPEPVPQRTHKIKRI